MTLRAHLFTKAPCGECVHSPGCKCCIWRQTGNWHFLFLWRLLTKVSGRDANIVFGDKLHRTEIFFGAGRHNWIEIGNVSFVEQAFKIESLGYPFSPAITN